MTTATITAQALAAPSTTPSVLGRLRLFIPARDTITFGEALAVAERQATALCRLLDPTEDGLDERHLVELPRLHIRRQQLPISGLSHWDGQRWVIVLNGGDSLARQRFTLLHEYKHIIDHGHATRLYRGTRRQTPAVQAEKAADYFAGCALVSKRALKSAWGNRLQQPAALAEHFGVSEDAIRVRLAQTGLDREADHLPSVRCARPVATPNGQAQRFRATTNWRRR